MLNQLILCLKTDWKDTLLEIAKKNISLDNFLLQCKDENKVVYPPQNMIFNAFNHFNISFL